MISTSRRWFSAILLAALLVTLPGVAGAALNAQYNLANVFLELEGVPAGWLGSFEGGYPAAEVIEEPMGPDSIIHKHIGQPKYGNITITFGLNMGQPVFQWMQEFLGGRPSRKSGAIIIADQNYNEKKRLVFQSALITEVSFPPLDATDGKRRLEFTLKLTPEITRPEQPKGGKVGAALGAKKLDGLAANFRVTIPGIDPRGVVRVDALTARQKILPTQGGQFRPQENTPAKLEIPNLAMEIAEPYMQGMSDWFADFVIKGNNNQNAERAATIEYLAQDLKGVLLTLQLKNLGVFKLESPKFEAGKDAGGRVKASMYAETLQFSSPGPGK